MSIFLAFFKIPEMFVKPKFNVLLAQISDTRINRMLHYFSKKTPPSKKIYSERAYLGTLFDQFNLQDIPMDKLLKCQTNIKQENIDYIHSILETDRPVSSSYFEFMSTVLNENGELILSKPAFKDAIPHLYRALIIYCRFFDDAIICHKFCADHPVIPYTAFQALKSMILIIPQMKEKYILPFLTEIQNLISSLTKHLPSFQKEPPSESFILESLELADVIGKSILQHTIYQDANETFLTYFASSFNTYAQNTTFTHKFLPNIFNYSEIVNKLLKSKTEIPILIKQKFFNSAVYSIAASNTAMSENNYKSENWVEIVVRMVGLINMFADSEAFNVQRYPHALYGAITWILKLNMHIEVPQIQNQILDPIKIEYDIKDLHIRKEKFYETKPSEQLLREKPVFNETSKIMESSLDKLCPLILFIIRKKWPLLSEIIFDFEKRPVFETQCAIIYFVTNISPESVTELLKEHPNLWSTLFTDLVLEGKCKEMNELALSLVLSIMSVSNDNAESLREFLITQIDENNVLKFEYVTNLYLDTINANSYYSLQSKYLNAFTKKLLEADSVFTQRIINGVNVKESQHCKSIILGFLRSCHQFPAFQQAFFSWGDNYVGFMSLTRQPEMNPLSFELLGKTLVVTKDFMFLNFISAFVDFVLTEKSIKEYAFIINGYCMAMRHALANDPKCIRTAFEGPMMTILPELCRRYAEEGYLEEASEICLAEIKLFYQYCKLDDEATKNLADFKYLENMVYVLTKIEITPDHLNAIASAIANENVTWEMNDFHMQNMTIVRLVYNTARELNRDDLIEKLTQIANGSPTNCFRCFHSKFLADIIENLKEYHTPAVYELIKTIGSLFFGANELQEFFHIMLTGSSEIVLHMLDTTQTLLANKLLIKRSMAFSVEGFPSYFINPCFRKLSRFRLSFMFRLRTPEPTTVLTIKSANSSIELKIGVRQILIVNHEGRVYEHAPLQPITMSDKWHRLSMELSKGEITMCVDRLTSTFLVVNGQTFAFHSHVSFDIDPTSKCAVDSLDISNVERLLTESSAPFPVPFHDVFPMSGGPIVFLPLSTIIPMHFEGAAIFRKIIHILAFLREEDETQFNRTFFRALGHHLRQIPPRCLDSDGINELGNLLMGIKTDLTLSYMLRMVWLDFGFWAQLKPDMISIFVNVLNRLIESRSVFIVNTLDFTSLLVKGADLFTKIRCPEAMKSYFKFLTSFIYLSHNNNRIPMMITIAFQDIDYDLQNCCLELLLRSLIKHPQSRECFTDIKIFVDLMRSSNSNAQYYSILFTELNKNVIKNYLQEMAPAIGGRKPSNNSDEVAKALLAAMYGCIKFNTNGPSIEDISSATLLNCGYLPLFASFLHVTNSAPQLISRFYDNLKGILLSRKALFSYPHWQFWIEYIGQLTEKINLMDRIRILYLDYKNNKKLVGFEEMLFECIKSTHCLGKSISERMDTFLIPIFQDSIPAVAVLSSFLLCVMPITNELPKISLNNDRPIDIFIKTAVASKAKLEFGTLESPFNPNYLKLAITVVSSIIQHTDEWRTEIDPTCDSSIPFIIAAVVLICKIAEVDQAEAEKLTTQLVNNADKGLATLIFGSDRKNAILYIGAHPKSTQAMVAAVTPLLIKKIGKDYMKGANDLMTNIKGSISIMHQKYVERMESCFEGFANETTKDTFLLIGNLGDPEFEKYNDAMKNAIENELRLENQNRKQSEKASISAARRMKEGGSLWTANTTQTAHYKIGTFLDSIGRRIRLKPNHHFDSHIQASLQRDSGHTIEKVTKARPFVTAEAETENDPGAAIFRAECHLITTSLTYTGYVSVFIDGIIFESEKAGSLFEAEMKPRSKIFELDLDEIKFALKRSYLHEDIGVEVFGGQGHSLYFVFNGGPKTRDAFMKRLKSIGVYAEFSSTKFLKNTNVIKKWTEGQMSNYEYLFMLNIASGRSFNDLTQYPVFPWIIKDYTSETIDLNNPDIYRDLSKPMGQLDEKRWEEIQMYFEELDSPFMKCHYRMFYSTPGYVIGFLIRTEPFASLHIDLQSGQFDYPGRLFRSINDTWISSSSGSADFRELIPEFFTLPDFLENLNRFDLGEFESKKVENVYLPPWAKTSDEFIRINRAALESPIVSANINKWVDLIFGKKQRGQAAVDAGNDFHPYSYPEVFQIEGAEEMREAIVSHALNFGVIPGQLFTSDSPTRQIGSFSVLSEKFTCAKAAEGKFRAVLESDGNIYGARAKGIISVYRTDSSQHQLRFIKNVIFDPRYKRVFSSSAILKKHIALIPKQNLVVLSSPWNNSFSIFSTEREEARKIEVGPPHAGFVSAIAVDKFQSMSDSTLAICSVSMDASTFVYQRKTRNQKTVGTTRLNSIMHSAPIADVTVDVSQDLIASVDEGGRVVLANLTNCSIFSGAEVFSAFDEQPPANFNEDSDSQSVSISGQSSYQYLDCLQDSVLTIDTEFKEENNNFEATVDQNQILRRERSNMWKQRQRAHVGIGHITSIGVLASGTIVVFLDHAVITLNAMGRVVTKRKFDSAVRCSAMFSDTLCERIAVGLANGSILIINAGTLENEASIPLAIQSIVFERPDVIYVVNDGGDLLSVSFA